MRISIKALEEVAKDRPSGYLQDVIKHGTVSGDYLEIAPFEYNQMLIKYRQIETITSGSHIRGLGDLVYKVANPIAHVIDKITGTHIQGCGGCAKRREALNKAVPFK